MKSRLKSRLKWIVMHCLLVTGLLVQGVASAVQPNQMAVDELIEVSGLKDQLSQLPAMIKMFEADPSFSRLPPEVKQSIYDSFTLRNLVAIFRVEVMGGVNKSEIEKLLSFYRSPIGERIIQVEREQSTPESQVALMQMDPGALSKDEKRISLVKEIDQRAGLTELQFKIQSKVMKVMMQAAMGERWVKEPGLRRQVEKKMEAQMQQKHTQLQEQIQTLLRYAYKDLELSDLEWYSKFLSTDPAKSFHKAVAAGHEALFIQVAEQIGVAIANAL